MRSVLKLGLSVVVIPLLALFGWGHAIGQPLSGAALSQMAALISDKRSRSPEEQKLDSNLLYAMRAVTQRLSANVIPRPAFVDNFIAENVGPDNTVAINVRAKVTENLLATLTNAGAQDLLHSPRLIR